MPLWLWIVVAIAGASAVLALLAWWTVRGVAAETKSLAARAGRLPWRSKARLAWLLFIDMRVPLWARALIPLLVLYLALPLDIIPDFIPVLGHLDDLLVIAIAAGLLVRSTPGAVLAEHIEHLEALAGRASGEGRAAGG